MKIILLVAGCILCATWGFSQQRQDKIILWPTDENTDKIVFSESVFTPELQQMALYNRAIKFATNYFKGATDTVVKNDEKKTVSCKSSFSIPVAELGDRGKGSVKFTFLIWCQSNSYRYLLTDLTHFPDNPDGVIGGPLENDKTASGSMLFPRQYWNDVKAKCYYKIQTTIERFKDAMGNESKG